jgi:hypothetical protein
MAKHLADVFDLLIRDRPRTRPVSDKTGNAGRVKDPQPGISGWIHSNKEITTKKGNTDRLPPVTPLAKIRFQRKKEGNTAHLEHRRSYFFLPRACPYCKPARI